MVVTRGASPDPHLDVLDESAWRLVVELDEGRRAQETQLTASNADGWVTIFDPPWPFATADELIVGWRVWQWREDEEGAQTNRALAPVVVVELLDLVPRRFHDWVLEATRDCLLAFEQSLPTFREDYGFDDMTRIVADVEALRKQVADAEERRAEAIRHAPRFYGQVHFYDLPAEVDKRWDLGTTDAGDEALLVWVDGDPERKQCRALLPPEEGAVDWRWTDARRWREGGRLLTSAEAMARVPKEFCGWVAAKTHESLQDLRHTLFDLGRRTLVDVDDLARIERLARHARLLASAPRVGSISYPGDGMRLGDEDHMAMAQTAESRVVVVLRRSWEHVLERHPEMEDHLNAIVETLEHPEHREPDVRPGRERFFRRGGPDGWLRVVVEMAGVVDRLVTAFPQVDPPENWRTR